MTFIGIIIGIIIKIINIVIVIVIITIDLVLMSLAGGGVGWGWRVTNRVPAYSGVRGGWRVIHNHDLPSGNQEQYTGRHHDLTLFRRRKSRLSRTHSRKKTEMAAEDKLVARKLIEEEAAELGSVSQRHKPAVLLSALGIFLQGHDDVTKWKHFPRN